VPIRCQMVAAECSAATLPIVRFGSDGMPRVSIGATGAARASLEQLSGASVATVATRPFARPVSAAIDSCNPTGYTWM